MYEYIKGEITESNPSFTTIETSGIGYFINISLNTFSKIKDLKSTKLFLHQIVREDAHKLYGFSSKSEREIFRHLISVSGVGSNTAIVMLSSLSPAEIKDAVLYENEKVLVSVKGIGAKTAKRLILDLKDKINKTEVDNSKIVTILDNTISIEALSALTMLGFQKNAADKTIKKILNEFPDYTVEQIVKESLKKL